MKRFLLTILMFACAAFAQDAPVFADVLRQAPVDAKLVLLSDDGRIVGYSEGLSRAELRVVLAEGFRGEAVLLITAPDGSVTHEFRALVDESGAVNVDGRILGDSLAEAGYGPPTFVTTGPPGDEPGGPASAPGQAGGTPGPPPQAGGPPTEGAGSGAGSGGGQGGGQGASGAGGNEQPDEGEDGDEDDGGPGGGPPDSAGPP